VNALAWEILSSLFWIGSPLSDFPHLPYSGPAGRASALMPDIKQETSSAESGQAFDNAVFLWIW